MDFPTAHALLRDRRQWRGTRNGAGVAEDGDLVLARVPGPADGKPVVVPATLPYTREVSGLATGPCDALFIADTAHDRVLFIDGLCKAEAWLPARREAWADAPGQFSKPRGLACSSGALLVADSGNARVQQLAWPRLEASLAWTAWHKPASVAVDSQQRVLVIDAAAASLHRVRASGNPDTLFDAAIAAQARLAQPLFVAVGSDDQVLVSDAQHNGVFVFDSDGAFVRTLPGPAGWLPGALAGLGTRIYVADAAHGMICVFEQGEQIGKVHGWSGPVTALALGPDGTLYIKPGLDAVFHRFAADAAYLAQGGLTAGPFDAGEERAWERVCVDALLPAGTGVTLEVAVAASELPGPAAADWVVLPAFDALLLHFTPDTRRFAWLRLTLASAGATATPRMQQARLATAAEDYLDYLPLTYRFNDSGPDGFLSRWLRLMRSEFGRIEELLDDMPRLADPQFGRPDTLTWLAQWFGLELPRIANDTERRELVARAVQLVARRGTGPSIAEFVKLHTGIDPILVEGFTDRRVWMLGQSSRLDFDTRLPSLDPLGDPLATYQIGLPLFAEEAYRFCVIVDGYRAADPQTLQEIARIVDREKPAHTDYRIEIIAPELRVGFQSRIGVDAIVGGEPPALALGRVRLSVTSSLPPSDVARLGDTTLDGSLTLT